MILHICDPVAWAEAQKTGEYRPPSLDLEGFIHASLPEQVLWVANHFYAGRKDLLLLWIDPQRVRPSIRYEPAEGTLFPHIYGGLNIDAVQAVCPFLPDDDGVFCQLPAIT
jgi:uncharacterized protein (DUF952 family)